MLKEKYNSISFPLTKTEGDSVLNSYLSEFGADSLKSVEGIKRMYLHILRDYLNGEVTIVEYELFCFSVVTDNVLFSIIELDPKLKSHIFDGMDILWLSESPLFPEYLSELNKYLKEETN